MVRKERENTERAKHKEQKKVLREEQKHRQERVDRLVQKRIQESMQEFRVEIARIVDRMEHQVEAGFLQDHTVIV